jgi:hypothetical protein
MEKEMSHPKIRNIRWLDPELPNLVVVAVTLIDKKIEDLDIPGMQTPETPSEVRIDLAKLSAVSPWYPKGSDEPSEKECFLDIDGVEKFVADVSIEEITEAWIYYHRCKK